MVGDLLQLHADLPHLFLGLDRVYKSVKGLNGLTSAVSSLAPSPEPSQEFSTAFSCPSSADSSSAAQGLAAKLSTMCALKAAWQAALEVRSRWFWLSPCDLMCHLQAPHV